MVAHSEQVETLVGGIFKDYVTPSKLEKKVEIDDMDDYDPGELYPEAFGMKGTSFDVREPSVLIKKPFDANLESEVS